MDIWRLDSVLLPHMFQVGTGDQHQIQVTDHLAGVTHYTATACTTHHEIEFEYLMPMDGIVELLLMAIRNIHEVVLAEWCNLT